MKGSYQLLIHLPRARKIKVGRLGVHPFPAGYYIYTGSGMGNLEARIARHLRREKKPKWHVDHLLNCGRVRQVFIYPSAAREECLMNMAAAGTQGGGFHVRGFGSSDCRCHGHLIRFGETDPSPRLLESVGAQIFDPPHPFP